MTQKPLSKAIKDAARRLGVTHVTTDADGTPTIHCRIPAAQGDSVASKLTDRHEQMIEAVLSGARTILEEHIIAIERGFAEVLGEEAARVAITATWKSVKDEGIVLEIAGKATIPATRTKRSVQLLGGQLSLFGGIEDSRESASH